MTFEGLALALANDYETIYCLNSNDDSYVEYGVSGEKKELVVRASGADFFADTAENCRKLVYKEDQAKFLAAFKKEYVLEVVNSGMAFTLNYRIMVKGEPRYYNIKTIRGIGSESDFIIVGVRNVDAQVRREQAAAAESETYSHIAKALASRYEVIYYIDMNTNAYIEYSSSEEYAKLGVNKKGEDFFTSAHTDIQEFIHAEDCDRLLDELSRDKFISNLRETGRLSLTYRQFLGGRTQYVTMLAVQPKNDTDHAIIGVFSIDAEKRREKAYRDALGNAMVIANHDPLTSVKNRNAYISTEAEMNDMIYDELNPDFAIAIFDVNGLKQVNDELGHIAGDQFIKSACELICSTFKHSPVFRVGGDEFVVLLTGGDLHKRKELFGEIDRVMQDHKRSRLVTVAYGVAEFDPATDKCVKDVFSRADDAMYEQKKFFKEKLLIDN